VTLLETIHDPAQLRALDYPQLEQLAAELREKMIRTVQSTGGHLASSLGAVEIAIALRRVLDSPRDPIVWDTGHQAYAHKLLTGRWERFDTLRQLDGVGGFPRRSDGVLDALNRAGIHGHLLKIALAEGFVHHGAVADLRRRQRIDAPGISEQIREALAANGIAARRAMRARVGAA
jgi:deoxyxylulose-5-phosphate synthase